MHSFNVTCSECVGFISLRFKKCRVEMSNMHACNLVGESLHFLHLLSMVNVTRSNDERWCHRTTSHDVSLRGSMVPRL